jgi:hypothetical protein
MKQKANIPIPQHMAKKGQRDHSIDRIRKDAFSTNDKRQIVQISVQTLKRWNMLTKAQTRAPPIGCNN